MSQLSLSLSLSCVCVCVCVCVSHAQLQPTKVIDDGFGIAQGIPRMMLGAWQLLHIWERILEIDVLRAVRTIVSALTYHHGSKQQATATATATATRNNNKQATNKQDIGRAMAGV
jgi:hypothetical protein